MQMKKDKFRVCNCLQLFCDIFGILVCNLVMNHSDQERLFTVKVLTAFLFSLLIFVFTIHNFLQSKCQYVTKITSQLDRCTAIA